MPIMVLEVENSILEPLYLLMRMQTLPVPWTVMDDDDGDGTYVEVEENDVDVEAVPTIVVRDEYDSHCEHHEYLVMVPSSYQSLGHYHYHNHHYDVEVGDEIIDDVMAAIDVLMVVDDMTTAAEYRHYLHEIDLD
jgi:hypothetical protein